jgi:hypothetical protein
VPVVLRVSRERLLEPEFLRRALKSAKTASTMVSSSPVTLAKIVDQPSAIRIPPPYIGWRTSR